MRGIDWKTVIIALAIGAVLMHLYHSKSKTKTGG